MQTYDLKGTYDIHVHCAPDVVPRAQDLIQLTQAAKQCGMAGMGIKDHTTCTAGRVATLNALYPQGPKLFSYLVLNPPVGGLNPYAVEAALRTGTDIICFPTYGAEYQIRTLGPDAFPAGFPRPQGFEGITIFDRKGNLKPDVSAIVTLIAQYNAVLSTGHIAPEESLALLAHAREHGVTRIVVNHASQPVPAMNLTQQQAAVANGAFIEHAMHAIAEGNARAIPVEEMRDQIHAIGAAHVILSSDLGQVANGPIIEGFGRNLDKLQRSGLSHEEMHQMLVENPRALLENRRASG